MPTSPPPNSRANGFTLIEMLVVLTVLGLLAGIMASNAGQQRGRFDRPRMAAELKAAIGEAKREARHSNGGVSVDPAATIAGAVLIDPIFPGSAKDALVVYPDGSTSGGVIAADGRPLLAVDWVTGEVTHVE